MNYFANLTNITKKLESEYKLYFNLIKDPNNKNEVIGMIKKIEILFQIIKTEIYKGKFNNSITQFLYLLVKNILRKECELNRYKEISAKHDERIIELNRILMLALNELNTGNNIFKLSSTSKSVNLSFFPPRDLVNFTLNTNTNFAPPKNFNLGRFLPASYSYPYPLEDKEMKSSILKFNLDDSQRLKNPIVEPVEPIVKKGTIFKISYPDEKVKDVFFKFTLSPDLIPSFFSGEIYNANSPFIIDRDVVLKVCACRNGYKDSTIKTYSYAVTDEENKIELVSKNKIGFLQGAERPAPLLIKETEGYRQIAISADEDGASSHCTPGSMYQQLSFHKRESNYGLDNEFEF
jgi:hypothetical protein